jgi:hypothetical protein
MIQLTIQLAVSLNTLDKQTFLIAERSIKACDIHPNRFCQHDRRGDEARGVPARADQCDIGTPVRF